MTHPAALPVPGKKGWSSLDLGMRTLRFTVAGVWGGGGRV